ncbi:hypothetical protein CRV24_007501 [Beauveria bassiana]|nr:hypothetical protein CRV24_007501 [Beauveria bassiana]KAH8712305.1 hypothetical protein HC256_005503 [Beauveria bassiana]
MDDEDILQNIDGRMHGPMNGFIGKYFGSFQHTYKGSILELGKDGRICGRYPVPSAAPLPDSFLSWFSELATCELDNARGSWHIISDNKAAEQNRAGFFLVMPSSSPSCVQMEWDCVQVIGQFHPNDCLPYQDGLIQLSRSAHEVFISQPTRLFLHGFYMRGSRVELWVFDRSGIFCSKAFDLQNDFAEFLPIALSYQHMTDQNLGKSNIFETGDDGNFFRLDGMVDGLSGKLNVEGHPIAARQSLVGTGTTCYRAKKPDSHNWNYALKLKWQWARDRPENELLNLAKKKRVWGAVSVKYCKELETTANLRRSLRWGTQRKFLTSSVGNKQNKDEENLRETTPSINGFLQYTKETTNFFQNRILICTVTSPLGRPLRSFQSLVELLQVLRDAIMCHRSLYYDARLLHRDISPGNIIILDHQDKEQPKGLLIDLDSAISLDEASEAELGITGTRPLMAIGVLRNEPHTCRHDLESFFYVLIWMIITDDTESPPEGSRLRRWSNGDWDSLAAHKTLDMTDEKFQELLSQFGSQFCSLKPLVEKLHQLLFPPRDGTAWTGTDGTPVAVGTLYEGMIAAFEEATTAEGQRLMQECN